MPGPIHRSVGTRVQSASAATLTPGLPTVDSSASGLLLCVVTSKNNATHSTVTAGWTKFTQVNSGASFTVSLFVATRSGRTSRDLGRGCCLFGFDFVLHVS
jgi:hypothetical protein